MSLGPIMVDIAGFELTAVEGEILCAPPVGGVVLFSRNYHDVEQLTALTRAVHELREPRLLVAVDQEGGRVQRLRRGLARLPAPTCYGQLYRRDPERARAAALTGGWLVGCELAALGIDFTFAPVLDLAGRNAVGDRAFHRDPGVVSTLAGAFVHGLRSAGMSAVGKHFPGHGGVAGDSHVARPEDPRSLDTIRANDLVPFARLITAGLPAIMPAHVIFTELDPRPAGYSGYWLQRVLREQLGFQGAVFSDDLAMEGAAEAGDMADRARCALQAGCDMALICQQQESVGEVVEAWADSPEPLRALRLARMHARPVEPDWQTLTASRRYREAVTEIESIDPEGQLALDEDD